MTESPTAGTRLLVKGGVVLSLDPAVGDFERADVLIGDDGTIAGVGPDLDVTDAPVLDAGAMIVIPGFVDTHHHLYQSQLRNVLPDGLLAEYFADVSGAATARYRPEDAYIGSLVGALRAIEAGITTIVDFSQASNTPEHSDALIAALKDSGIRALYAYARGAVPGQPHPGDAERILATHFSSTDQLVTMALATSLDKEQWLLARRLGLRNLSHVVGSVPGITPSDVMRLDDQGLMGDNNVYIHFTGADAAQLRRVKDTGGWLSISAPIEMTMGHGMPPLQAALDAGIRPSLSSDVETTMAADMFTQMRSVFTVQRALLNERAIGGEADLPPLLSSREVLELATVHGARCAGLYDRTGTLTPGKQADLVLLRTDLLNTMPLNNAAGAIVTAMDTSNVDTVFIAGKVVKRGGKMAGFDLPELGRRATASRDHLVRTLGWTPSVLDRAADRGE
ncbi:amidohydrolase family protein [Streptomyces sp. NPDC047043]|uniref:amidohydrolase family protein n=1 Tax=Streptomyces sp. NPDC047043 TaxID=3154497 RepID=UPI0033C86EBD